MIDPVDGIMQVMNKAFLPAFGEAWTRRQVCDALVLPNTYFMLAGTHGGSPEQIEEAIGFTLSRKAADEEELLLIAVHPDHRGAGIGRKLLVDFLSSARARGSERIFLEMRSGNPAGDLYRSVGFRQVGLRKGYYRGAVGGPLDAITFALDPE